MVLALGAANVRAEIVTIKLEGELTYVDPYLTWLNENFTVGDVITGTYVYDTATPDTSGSSRSGHYWYYSEPYGLSLSSGGYVFRTDPSNVEFLIAVLNRDADDGYLLRSYNNLALPDDVIVDHISWQLNDYSGTALSSDALLATPLILEDWESIYGLMVTFGYKGGWGIRAEVTSVELIPEPATVFLLGFGALMLLKQRKA